MGMANSFFGTQAGAFNNGDVNSFFGAFAGSQNTRGGGNSFFGARAGSSNTSGFANSFFGSGAGLFNEEGSSNSFFGLGSGTSNQRGEHNSFFGFWSGVNSTGSGNSFFGDNAGAWNGSENNNSFFGSRAGSTSIGSGNTFVGAGANGAARVNNATAIGANAVVDASNKIRLGNTDVTVIEGQVAFTYPSDMTKKENFRPVDGEDVLKKIRALRLTSWNLIGHDPKQFRHYGPMAQEFFAAFGDDGIGTIGTPTTINSGDIAGILMVAVQTLEKRAAELAQQKDSLKRTVESVEAENSELKARLERLERIVGR